MMSPSSGEGASGVGSAGSAFVKPRRILHSVAGRARVALAARGAGGPSAAQAGGATAAVVAPPETPFEADRRRVLAWFAMPAEARERVIAEHAGRLTVARHLQLFTHVRMLLEDTQVRTVAGVDDGAWEQQLRELATEAEHLAAIGSAVGDALFARLDAGEPAPAASEPVASAASAPPSAA